MDIPSPGRIVRYQLSAADAEAINKRRADAQACMNMHRAHSTGVQVHVGNPVEAGQVYPLFITRAWGSEPDSAVNGQVFLDGNDVFWAMSVRVGDGPGHFTWPSR